MTKFLAYIVFLGSFLSVMPSPLSDLGPRFNRILSMVKGIRPNPKVVADVGCDHGLLSGRIAHWDSVKYVIGSDVSTSAAKGALAHYESLEKPHRDKLELLIGDGLNPLVDKGVTNCDALILSGMGVRSVFNILSMPSNDGARANNLVSSDDFWADSKGINTPLLDSLGITDIIVQPWPPNFLPLQSLFSCMLQEGQWDFKAQGVDYLNGYHHVTTHLQRTKYEGGGKSGIQNPANKSTLHIASNPLYKQCHGVSARKDTVSADWRDYLMVQGKSLLQKKKGLAARKQNRGNSEKAEMAALAKLRRAIPDFNLDEVIGLLDDHIESMK